MSEVMSTMEIAAKLSVIMDTIIAPIDGGFRVRETGTHYIDVMHMFVNWRVTETSKATPWEYGRYWCFAGAGAVGLLTAVRAVIEWDCGKDTEPAGWVKNGQTGELAPRPTADRS